MTQKIVIAGIALLLVIGGGYAVYQNSKNSMGVTPAPTATPTPSSDSEKIVLPLQELGVQIEVPGTMTGIMYLPKTVQAIGNVAEISTTMLRQENPSCALGVAYNIMKSQVSAGKTQWTEQSLKDATESRGNNPPQVKEFEDFYFVFEPSQAVCSSDALAESEARIAVWNAIQNAEKIEP